MKYLKIISNRHSGRINYLRLREGGATANELFQKFCQRCGPELPEAQGHFTRLAQLRLNLKTAYGDRLKSNPIFADLSVLFAEWLEIEGEGEPAEGEDILADRSATVEEFTPPF